MRLKLKMAFLLFGLALITYSIFRMYRAEKWNEYSSYGAFLYRQGHYDLAINKWQKALSLIPDDGYKHYQIANAYYKQGKFSQGMAEYRMSLRFRPDDARAYLGLGDILRDEGEHERSVAQYRKALKIDPTLKLSRPDLRKYE